MGRRESKECNTSENIRPQTKRVTKASVAKEKLRATKNNTSPKPIPENILKLPDLNFE
jgi:hypothetical protein